MQTLPENFFNLIDYWNHLLSLFMQNSEAETILCGYTTVSKNKFSYSACIIRLKIVLKVFIES